MAMIFREKYIFSFSVLILLIALLQTGCKKEYSYEGGPAPVITHDSIITPHVTVNTFSGCSLCKATNDLSLSTWNFKIGNSYLCGTVDGAGIDFKKTAFTFFGPSAYSIDTGLVMTIYLPLPLNEDKFNIITTKTAFFYYDHHAANDILISRPATAFTVTLKSFIYATGICTGNFYGTVFKPNGDAVIISDGNFKIKFK